MLQKWIQFWTISFQSSKSQFRIKFINWNKKLKNLCIFANNKQVYLFKRHRNSPLTESFKGILSCLVADDHAENYQDTWSASWSKRGLMRYFHIPVHSISVVPFARNVVWHYHGEKFFLFNWLILDIDVAVFGEFCQFLGNISLL